MRGCGLLAVVVMMMMGNGCRCQDPGDDDDFSAILEVFSNNNNNVTGEEAAGSTETIKIVETLPTMKPVEFTTPFVDIRPDPPPQGVPPGECDCVPFYLCNENNTIITDGTGVIDIRFQDGQECGYMEVCCKVPLPPDTPITPKPIGHSSCGIRHSEGVGFRITGEADNEAQFGEFSWMVAILREEPLDDGPVLNVYQCGGSLIHKNVVLTAAHCVVKKDPATLKARAGEWDTQTKHEIYPYQDRRVVEIISHKGYYAGGLFNDIALLILDKPFDYAENVDITCLPNQDDIVIHDKCFATGWGKDIYGKEGKYQVILKKVELPIVPRKECEERLRETRLGRYFQLHKSFICAGGEFGKDTCKGDGGGPLVCPVPGSDSQYQQVGIVAWGVGCGDNYPAVYVNVAHFRNWIDEKMAHLKFEPEYDYRAVQGKREGDPLPTFGPRSDTI